MEPIKGYEGLYSITRDGMVWSHNRLVKKRNHYYKQKGRWLKNCFDQWGYAIVSLSKNGKRPQYKVHRLVAQIYIPNPLNKPQINHKNGIKDDNRIENLEWCTPKENIRHGWKIGLNSASKGEKNGMSKLTQYQVEEIRNNHVNRLLGEKTWEKYNICRRQYYRVLRKENW